MITDKEWNEIPGGTIFVCPVCFEDFDVAKRPETCPHCNTIHGIDLVEETKRYRYSMLQDKLREMRSINARSQ